MPPFAYAGYHLLQPPGGGIDGRDEKPRRRRVLVRLVVWAALPWPSMVLVSGAHLVTMPATMVYDLDHDSDDDDREADHDDAGRQRGGDHDDGDRIRRNIRATPSRR